MWTIICLAAFLFTAVTGKTQEVKAYDAEPNTYIYPYPVKFFSLENQGLRLKMAYMDVKPAKGNGRTVLSLHGKNFCAAYWDSTAAALTHKGFRVIMPGCHIRIPVGPPAVI